MSPRLNAAKPVRVEVIDPVSGDVLSEYDLKNDFVLICHGSSYLYGEQHYTTTGTTILTIKRRDPLDETIVPNPPGGGS